MRYSTLTSGRSRSSIYLLPMHKTVQATLALLFLAATSLMAADAPHLAFDHVWIVVSPSAPEQAALERAGFQISPDINRHDGQGTASVTVEFQNAYLELIWPDSTVAVSPGMERAQEKFRQRMLWRTSGWCPIGVGLRRTSKSPDTFPFPTWSVAPAWLPKGSAIEILTPRDDTRSPSLFITPAALTDTQEQAARAARFNHPIGVHTVTGVRLISPETYQPIAALTYLQKQGILSTGRGETWLLELTFDGGKKGKSKDLRPDLPLIVRY